MQSQYIYIYFKKVPLSFHETYLQAFFINVLDLVGSTAVNLQRNMGMLVVTHFLTSVLNVFLSSMLLKLVGTEFHNTAPSKLKLFFTSVRLV